jgi:hypothetical protein
LCVAWRRRRPHSDSDRCPQIVADSVAVTAACSVGFGVGSGRLRCLSALCRLPPASVLVPVSGKIQRMDSAAVAGFFKSQASVSVPSPSTPVIYAEISED